ncbi:hypothetical protein HELRODRAFT_96655, partial [Helobdella robusta]|uniref:Nuclear respiratory factor 1 NLS/DNA-binding dimerisation domain-containing protein n=1 Tax=Helobdella robusta TaxID=6412 RepID=T1G9D1_HELRO
MLDNSHAMFVIGPVHSMADTISEASSLDGACSNVYNDPNFTNPVTDDITAQLASAGPVGVAAAAAISTGKNRKRPHSFEINPTVRKRQQTRLLRKLLATLSEYTTRVGQQAVLLCCTPGKTNPLYYRVFGSQPLEDVLKEEKSVILADLDNKLALQAPHKSSDKDFNKHELPPLNVEGIPTPIDKMTQAQLRMFIPEMLKYSTCRSKPGWGKEGLMPVWWPADVPWANIRCDVRSDEDKQKVSWTSALRQIVLSCYTYHDRLDLLPTYKDDTNNDNNNVDDDDNINNSS